MPYGVEMSFRYVDVHLQWEAMQEYLGSDRKRSNITAAHSTTAGDECKLAFWSTASSEYECRKKTVSTKFGRMLATVGLDQNTQHCKRWLQDRAAYDALTACASWQQIFPRVSAALVCVANGVQPNDDIFMAPVHVIHHSDTEDGAESDSDGR